MEKTHDVEAQRRQGVVLDLSRTRTAAEPVRLSRTRTQAPGLPVEFRTLSIHVETRASERVRAPTKDHGVEKRKLAVKGLWICPSHIRARVSYFTELSSLDWHRLSIEEVLNRLRVSATTGLEAAQVQRLTTENGKNTISPPKSNMGRKILEWIFGGFGSLLLAASIVCFVAW